MLEKIQMTLILALRRLERLLWLPIVVWRQNSQNAVVAVEILSNALLFNSDAGTANSLEYNLRGQSEPHQLVPRALEKKYW